MTFGKSKGTSKFANSYHCIITFFPVKIKLNYTLLYPTLPYSTLLYSTRLYSTLLYPTLPYSTLLYPTLPYSTLLYPILPYSTLLYPTLPYSTLPYQTIVYHTIPYQTRLDYTTLSYLWPLVDDGLRPFQSLRSNMPQVPTCRHFSSMWIASCHTASA